MKKVLFTLLIMAILCPSSFLMAIDSADEEEIAHLLEYIQTSDCMFIRNGKAYNVEKGLEHVKKKYEYFKTKIKTAEDFIRYSATKSELSEKMYYVQLPDGSKVFLKNWLLKELARFRAKRKG